TTGQSDPTKGTGGNNTRVVTAADVTGCSTNCSVQSVTVAAPADEALAGNVTVVVRPTVVGTYNIGLLLTNTQGTSGGTDDVNFASGTAAAVAVQPYLRHMGGSGDNTVVTVQDVYNNVRGSRHVVCVTDGQDTATGGAHGVVIPLSQANQILIENGGGYETPGDQVQTFSDPQFFTKTVNGSLATCFSWVSTGAGDQQLVATYPNVNGGVVTVNWGGTAVNKSLVKEWNVLETSTITGLTPTSGAGTASVGFTVSRTLSLDPNTGLHKFTPVNLIDAFNGSHVTTTGSTAVVGGLTTQGISLAGVHWTVALASNSCGILTGSAFSGDTYNDSTGNVDPASLPNVTLTQGNNSATDCTMSRTATVIFTGTEPGPLGSGAGNTVTQTVVISFTQPIPIKQVLLAWAGQRVLLDHDWRIPPGEGLVSSTAPVPGACPFPTGGTHITYIKGAEGPGNFVAGLNATLNGADQASVTLTGNTQGYADNSQKGDYPSSPQDACISRVIYESEDQGEVDVEAFPASTTLGGVGKVAFVIYYMKLNQVQLSLVTQVAKPTHNLSGPGYYADYAPGNPWDASKDATSGSADWNVSKDILVRGRVTGWFTNSNPSGRARDDSNKQNVLPADRWVMPDDWANIAGGAALASTFRPSYDLMFAPNNAAGFALGLPYSTVASSANVPGNQIAAVAATSTGKGNGFGSPITNLPIVVTTKAFMSVGQTILIGNQAAVICGISPTSNSITVRPLNAVTYTCNGFPGTASGLTTAPAAGTPIFAFLAGVPFVGPYSLVDIPNFSGVLGAAENNNGGQMPATASIWRDTTQGDGVVDWWDAPMPPAETSVAIRGTGFIKQVLKETVYYNGTPVTDAVANGGTQYFPNPYYYQNIPASPWLPAVASGGGFIWDSWGGDGPNVTGCFFGAATCAGGNGPYHFWQPAIIGTNSYGVGDSTVSSVNAVELAGIRLTYSDPTIARDLVVYSDNHGEFMVTANGDFKTDLSACATNVLAGGKQCKPGDKVGVGTISAVADYPDFVKHFPVASNAVTVNWTWGGYKDVTVEKGETDQYSYLVFHAMDRDGHCAASDGAVLLHPVLTSLDAKALGQGTASNGIYSHYPTPNQLETVDFLIDSGNGIILGNSGSPYGYTSNATLSGERGNLIGVPTYSVAVETAYSTGMKTFPLSPLAASGQTDECQAWIKISNSLLGVTNVLTIAHDDEGNIGFDKVIDFQTTMSYTLNFRWSLVTWNGADNIPVADALKGGASTKNPAGNDISASVTAVYGWAQDAQQWLAFFPTGVNVPGANNLTALKGGSAYWIAITGPGSVTWTVSTNVD
ncbi:MAG: hypothetical protein LC118_18400, partial [Dehalococcoidia bacterium]|nr:hypothetical protein [Dehalococcoidia bacterium]